MRAFGVHRSAFGVHRRSLLLSLEEAKREALLTGRQAVPACSGSEAEEVKRDTPYIPQASRPGLRWGRRSWRGEAGANQPVSEPCQFT